MHEETYNSLEISLLSWKSPKIFCMVRSSDASYVMSKSIFLETNFGEENPLEWILVETREAVSERLSGVFVVNMGFSLETDL